MPKFAGTRQKLRVCVRTAFGNDATRDGARIDLNQQACGQGCRRFCLVYVRPRPPLPAVAIASYQADSSIQITKPHRVTNQNSESQMNTSSRFIVGARFGEVPTLVRVQRCGLGRPPSTCASPTARPRWLCWWRSTTQRRAVQSNMLGRLLLLNAATAPAVSFTLSPRLIIFSPKAEITPRS